MLQWRFRSFWFRFGSFLSSGCFFLIVKKFWFTSEIIDFRTLKNGNIFIFIFFFLKSKIQTLKIGVFDMRKKNIVRIFRIRFFFGLCSFEYSECFSLQIFFFKSVGFVAIFVIVFFFFHIQLRSLNGERNILALMF